MNIYENGNVTVDRDFVRFGAKSYAIRQINSVEVKTTEAKKSNAALLGAIAAVALVVSFPAGQPGLFILAIILGIAALVQKLKKRFNLYHLVLHTSSSQVQAYETRDDDDIVQLRTAIEAAMAGRAPA